MDGDRPSCARIASRGSALYNEHMGFFSRRRSAQKQRSEAVIDIGSHSIKALVFEQTAEDAPPRVLKKMVDRLPLGAEQIRVAAKLHELMFFLVRQMGGAPGKVTVAVGPYLADYSLASLAAEAPKELEISRSELARMFRDIAQNRQEPDRTLWTYPTAVFANGYGVEPDEAGSISSIRFLKKARSGQSASFSFAALRMSLPRRVAETLEEARFAWGGMPIEFVPLPLAYVRALAHIGEARNYLMIDIGGEETMLMRVQGAVPQSVRFFSVGTHAFIRAAAKDGNVSFREAEDMLRAPARGSARSGRGARGAGAPSGAGGAWSDSFVRTLDEDYHLGPLSENVILAGGGAEFPEIEATVRAGGWMQKFSPVSLPAVRILAGSSFFQGMSLAGSVDGPEDAGLAALMYYAIRHNDLF